MNDDLGPANGDLQLLQRAVNELTERLRLTEKQLLKTHRIAVDAYRTANPNSLSPDEDPDDAVDDSIDDEPESVIETIDDEDASNPPEPPAPPEAGYADPASPPSHPPAAQTPMNPAPAAQPPAAHPPAAQAAAPPAAAPMAQPAFAQAANVAHPNAAAPDEWPRILLGEELAGAQGLDSDRLALLSGLRCGEPAAGLLIGALLVFRNSPADRMAQQLKDVGEAFYRWRPETAGAHDLFRQALIAMLHSLCEQAGVFNRIELVQPGDRFDSARHHTKERGGMEVVDVQGWVVLRENGKPYTKANVTVR